MHNIWTKWYECTCHGEGIMLAYEDDNTMDMAIFEYGYEGSKLDFRGRLRFCWKIITTGFPWGDAIVLNKETAKTLGTDLINWSERKKSHISNRKLEEIQELEGCKESLSQEIMKNSVLHV